MAAIMIKLIEWRRTTSRHAQVIASARLILPSLLLALSGAIGSVFFSSPAGARTVDAVTVASVYTAQAYNETVYTPVADAYMEFVPEGSAPPNGGTVTMGDRFVLGLWLNSGSHGAVLGQQSYLTYTFRLIKNASVADIPTICVLTHTVTPDPSVFDATLQNEICNGWGPNGDQVCFAGHQQIPPGTFAFASGAIDNPPASGYFRVARTGWCAMAPGQAVLHWEFWPPAPITRDTEIVDVDYNIISDRTLFTDYIINIVTPTNTPTSTPTPTATIVQDAFMEFVPEGSAPPNGGTVTVGDKFVLGLWLNAGSQDDVVAAQSYLTFSWQLLQNVRMAGTSCVPTVMFTADLTTFDIVLQNEVCNGPYWCTQHVPPGQMAYASGVFPPNPGYGGTFRVAQMAWCAVAPGQAVLHWQFTPPGPQTRDTQIADVNGNLIQNRALFSDYVINIVTPTSTPTATPMPPVLVGHVNWQGRSPQPTTLQQLPVTFTLKMGMTEVNYPAQTTDASGFFTVSVVGLPEGIYNWRVKGAKYLANSGNVTLTGGSTTAVEMGLIKVGDSDNDNIVNASDFAIVQRSFGRTIGHSRYDDRAEFTGDQIVSVYEFNLMKVNFGQAGAPPIGPGR